MEMVGEHRTCLEKQMYGYLIDFGLKPNVDFHEQYPTGGFILDFAFIQSRKPFHGLDIEVDGAKWHNTPKSRQRDGYRTYLLMKSGWIVERFSETFNKSEVEEILKKHGILKPSE
jgi:very-short-patch-repair endonuclease